MTADFPTSVVGFSATGFQKTNALGTSVITSDIVTASTTFTVQDATSNTPWPTANFVVRIKTELIFCSSRSGNTITIGSRGFDGTTEVDHSDGEQVLVVASSAFMQKMADEVVAVENNLQGAWFNVKEHGAKGDGTTDDAAAIQAAIAAASAAGGGTVFFPKGTYTVGARVELKSNVNLEGVGAFSIIKPLTGIVTSVIVGLGADTVSDLTIQSLRIDGNSAVVATNIHGIQITSGNRITISDVRFTDIADNAINLNSTPSVTVRGCNIESAGETGTSGHGIQAVSGCHFFNAHGNRITGVKNGMGIRLGQSGAGSTDGRIVNNYIKMSTGALECIGVTSDCNRTVVENNVCIEGKDNGISVSAVHSALVGNTVRQANLHGIQINAANVSVVGNVCSNNNQTGGATRAGIHVNSVNNVVIVGNRCYDDQGVQTQDFGVKANGVETGIVVVGNSLSSNKTSETSGVTNANVIANGDEWIVPKSLTMRSGTTFDGKVTHAITAARTWTFPDATGTVAVITNSDALGGGAAPTFGTIGGTGPATAAQNSWQRIRLIDGSTAWVPVWK